MRRVMDVLLAIAGANCLLQLVIVCIQPDPITITGLVLAPVFLAIVYFSRQVVRSATSRP